MDIVIFFNGLGNQMSQYAFYLQKKKLNKSTTFITMNSDHNGLELDRVFKLNVEENSLQKACYLLFRMLNFGRIGLVKKLNGYIAGRLNIKIVDENFDYNFNAAFLNHSGNITYYYGGWHSEKYFVSVKNEIIKAFKFSKPVDPQNTVYINQIKNTASVALHVRRGDYLNATNFNLFGEVCTKSYFEKAISIINNKVDNPHFFVFSDDLLWVQANLDIKNCTYITGNLKNNSWKDMYLMTICKHNIISNSSFSWWGAWLNNNADKIVISPSRFLKNDISTDFYPESWIRLADY